MRAQPPFDVVTGVRIATRRHRALIDDAPRRHSGVSRALIDDATRRHSGGESRDVDEHDDDIACTLDEFRVVVIVDVV